ncbi:hypothetical protein, partial [Pseudomonas coronafaciens]|uniref:hypothetical protein n=1 Tax=Pseudomonas coronafaciens TaxID=53409 RepID=UPI001CC1D967
HGNESARTEMISRTMSHFDPHHKYPAACIHAVGLDASSIGTLLLSLSTIAGTEISNPSWVNFQSAGWVSFQSAPTSSG